jgi:hypothetical protein
VLVFCAIQFTLCSCSAAAAAEPSLIALDVSTPLAALLKPSNFKPPDIILAAFQLLLN